MADLFNNSKPVDYDTQVNNKPSLYQDKLNEVRNEQAARLENRQRYGVELTDDEYSQINTLIANAENPDEESHKIASAILVSQNTNIPLAESYQNIDSYIQGLWGNSEKTTSYKNAFVAITDMFAMGANNMKIGVLGNKIIQAEKDGDEEAKQVYMNEYKALMDDNALRQDNAPRTWATKILECGAQSAPYTGAVSGAAVLGSFLGPAGSVAASAITSTALMRGEIYMDMRSKGIEPEIARPASLVSALPQAIVESFLGEAASWAGAGIKALGKGSSKAISSKLAGKLANTMQAKFKFGVGAKLAVKGISEYFGNLAEEGAEEYIQEGIGSVVENVASKKQTKLNQERRAEILEGMATELGEQFTKDFEEELLKEYPDIDVKSFAEIHSNMVESFKGGVMGAIALGAVPTAINTTLTAKEYGIIKDVAEEIPSKEMFKKFAKENPDAKKVFEQFEEGKERDDAISKTWEAAQNTRDKKDAELIAGTKETTAFSEQMEAAPEENEEGETEVIPAYRTKEGRLYTNVEDKTDSDGNEYKTFTVGNAEAEDKNLYGFINYKTDEETNTVTITDFKMAAHRRGLTQEAFEQFAEDHAGENIEWNPTSKRGKELKNYLISQNASGKNNGLNYYKTQDDLVDLESRRNVSKQLRKYMPNLTSDQHAAAISLLEAGARRMGKRLNEYVSETFGNQIIKGIGDTHNVEQIFRKFIDTTFNNEKESNNELTFEKFLKDKYNKNSLNEFTEDEIKQIVSQNVKGYSTMPDFQRQVKAVIYAGEHADFSTFAHELAHVWQSQLTGDLKAEAEAAFNVKDGDWNNSYYTFADGHTESAAEAFARGFEDYLRNGKAPNEQMKNLFQKFAEFFQDVYRNLKNFINMSPEIENVYNQLMDADDSVMKLAEKAVMDADKEYIQSIKNDIEAKKAAEAQQKKDEKQAKEDAKAEDEEITLSDETVTEPDLNSFEEETEEPAAPAKEKENKVIETEEELNKNLNDLMSFFDEMADTEQETETQIKDAALEALESMTFAESKDVVETITNKEPEIVTLTEKVEKATDAASEVRDDEFFIFQLAGLEGTRNIVDTQERARRIENYYIAKKMSERDNLGYDKETLARKIKQSTGWEKNASGQWVYETDDTQGIINSKVSEILDNGRANALSDTRIPAIRLSALYKNDELYEMYPIAKDFSVQFFTDKIGVNAFIKADGIAINTVGLADPATLKRRLVHEIQHIIQAVENFAEGNTDVSKTGIHGKDFNELWQSLQQAQLTDGTMFDASNLDVNMGNYMNNAAEIDARNVARRAFMSAKERQNSLLSDTADVKNENILFQLIGEKGATNLDLAEEVTTRRDNLAIAKEMEKAGKDAKAIRLATGWEKGKDGLYRYEIADDYHLKNIRATNAKLEKYEKQLKKAKKDYEYLTGLTEEEKEKKRRMIADMVKHNAMPEGTTLESMIEEAETELRKAEMLMEYDTSLDVEQALKRLIERGIDPTDFWADMGESFYLPMLIDNEELFKAYPELEKVTIAFSRKYVDNHMGSYDPEEKSITIYPAGARSYGDFLSVLAHEVQHAIQRIEGFAVGGSQAQFKEMEAPSKLQEKIMLLDDIPMNELMNYKQHDEFKFLKENLPEVLEDNIDGLGTLEQIMDRWLEDVKNGIHTIKNVYDEIQNARKAYNKYNRLNEYANEKTAFEKYESLAGEVEARNVQARKRLTPEERLNTLLSETADVAPEDQIVMFEGGISESREMLDEEYKIAVESGNIEKALQMLQEEAARKGYTSNSEYQGTSAFNGAAPYRNGYFETKEERLQAIKDEAFEDTETLGDFAYDNADALGFDYLINDSRAYRAADEKRKEAIDNLRNAVNEARSGKKNVKIKMYRSVPIDIKENSFRNGDWITPSKSYAKDNADVHNWNEGEYRIIEQEVDLEHIWWDGNDIAEWGYDDEKEAVYKNTENNRKLFEITYDENGNLIPLSERFNENNSNMLFQLSLADAKKQYPNIVDLSDIFNEKPSIQDLTDYLRGTIGNETITLDNNYKIVIPQNGKKRGHIIDSSRYYYLKNPRHKDDLERHNAYVLAAKELIKNAVYSTMQPNTKPLKKPNVLNYYYFTVPVYINGHGYKLVLDAEEMKKGAARPQNNSAVRALSTNTNNTNVTLKNLQAVFLYDIIEDQMLFQTVYHGSGANFERFNTEQYGFSGEGSMSFGYGTYLTDDEEIARDYAERQRKRVLNKESVNPYDRGTLEYEMFEDLRSDSFNFSKTLYKKYLQKEAENIKNDPDNPYQDFKANEKLAVIDNLVLGEEDNKTNLYTVEIPDGGYLHWEERISDEEKQRIVSELKKQHDELVSYSGKLKNEDLLTFEGITGSGIYAGVKLILNNDEKAASKFLHSIGYAGIKYPAGTIHGNGNGAYNYVIFNDEEAKIVDHLLFQTQQELFKDAMNFDSWQEFMEYYENEGGKPEVSLVPEEADAAWYKATWEMAKGITHESSEDKTSDESMSQRTMDALFMAHISAPGQLEEFLKQLNYINTLDFENLSPAMDAEEQAERDKEMQLKDVIRNKLSHGSWLSNATRIAKGKELTPATRNRLLTLMNLASREYRDVYTQITGNTEFAVSENESFFNENIAANAKKLNKLVSPEEAVTMSPEQLRNLADSLSDEVSNKEIAAKIKNGTLKMDSELTDYIKRLEKRVKAAEDRFNKLEEETKADYGRIKDFAQRRILNTYDELLKARAKLNNKKNLLDKKITSGLKITEKYRKDVQNAQSTYDDIFITWNNLTKVTKISAEVQEAMKRKEEYIQTVEEQAKLKNDKAILTQISDMRRKLVKNAMRRVPLNRIEYGHAKKIIAIQRLLYPNLEFGVNKWIGENAVYIKGLAAEYLTNPETKEQIDKAIRYRIARAGTAAKLKKLNRLQELLAAMKTSDDINTWTDAEKNNLLRYIPKNDWIKELNLEALEKERAETIQLDIDEEGYSEVRTITDEKGNEYFKTLYRPKFSEEIGEMVKDAIGVDMFNLLINKPFEDWNTSQMEKLTKRINELYIEGRDELEAKRQLQKDEANEIRERIRNTIRATDIKINDTDTPEERKRKQEEINKLLGTSETTKGTLASKKEKRAGKINAILHGFADANVRRFARILDNLDEGANVEELYYKENLCYEAKQEMLRKRGRKINEVMRENKIELDELYKTIKVGNKEFTVDELLFFLAADKDYEQKESFNLEDLDTDPYADNDDYAPTARNAVMFGNLGSADNLTEWKESLRQLDEDTKERIQNDQLTEDEKQAVLKGMKLITTPGTRSYIQYCHNEYAQVIKAAKAFLAAEENAKFNKLAEAIEADYTEQFERLQRVSIEEFNAEVFRVKAYVPLNRMESNGDTNENRVKEDLLATSGASAGKNYVDKGMTQKRRTMSPLNQKPVEMGLYKTWADATERTEHFINYASYVRELNRVYKSRDAQYLRRFIENRHGKAALEYIDNYIAEVANPNATSATGAIDSFVKLLRGKAAPAYLSWKASSIIKQAATSPAPYMQFITPVEYLKACFDIIASKGTLNDDIKEKSVFMENRTMDPLLDLVKEQLEAKTNKIEHKFNQIGAIGMQGLEWIDWACVAPGWLACYRKKFAELVKANDPSLIEEQIIAENTKLDPSDPARLTKDEIRAEVESRLLSEDDLEKEAVHYADDCTRLCQPSNRSVDLAPLFKNKEKNSEIGKAVLQFQTSLNVIWNNIRYDIPYAVRQKKFKQIAGMIFGYIFAGILVNSITEGYKVNEEDDEEKQQLDRLRKFLYYSTTQFTDAIPVIGGAVTQANSKIIGGNKGFASSSADIFPMFTKVIDGTKAITKGDWEKAAWKYGEAAGLATGFPVSGTKEILYAAGIGDKDGQLEFDPAAFAGRRD